MASARSTTTRSAAQRGGEEGMELKESVAETLQHGLQQGKEMLTNVAHDGGDKMLALALLLHAAVNGWQGWSLLFNPEFIVPGLFGIGEKLHLNAPAQNTLLRAFGLQTMAMALVAGGAAFRYDTKHKAILNGVLLLFHIFCVGDLFWNKWGSAETSGFRVGPGFFHGPMMVAHAVALLAYMRPEGFFSGGGGGVGRGMGSKMKGT